MNDDKHVGNELFLLLHHPPLVTKEVKFEKMYSHTIFGLAH